LILLLESVLWMLVAGGVCYLLWQYRSKLPLPDLSRPGDDAYYKGIFYDNAHDSRLLVPERWGGGFTINAAHRFAGAALVLMFGVPICSFILLAVLR
jgi:uncharacterized membrane protein